MKSDFSKTIAEAIRDAGMWGRQESRDEKRSEDTAKNS